MKTAQRTLLGLSLAAFFFLLWKVPMREVWGHLNQIGWGLLIILVQEGAAHCMNVRGWRNAFLPGDSGRLSFLELFKLRVAGDGVNYLTPTGTIGGEFIRAELLPPRLSPETRYACVAVAKFTQALGQALFVLIGLLLLIDLSTLETYGHPAAFRGARWGLGGLLLSLGLFGLWVWRRTPAAEDPNPWTHSPQTSGPRGWMRILGAVPDQCRHYFRNHPWRFLASTLWFHLGFAWGIFEAYWICRFLGAPVSIRTAAAIEVLSQLVDGALFMVPAKIGTQEAGKTAVFMALGLRSSVGFAFGLVRHFRELCWAGAGLILYTLSLRPGRKPSPPPLAQDPELGAPDPGSQAAVGPLASSNRIPPSDRASRSLGLSKVSNSV